jgi:Spy/CpxP family protein refolding chaperone
LIGLFAVSRHRHHWNGRRHWGRHGSFQLRRVLDRLDTTPGQEKEIRIALDDLMEEARSARRDFRGSREELARVIREPEVPPGAFDAVFRTQDEILGRLREAAQKAFLRIHETLDPRQREKLASLVESAGFFHAHGAC